MKFILIPLFVSSMLLAQDPATSPPKPAAEISDTTVVGSTSGVKITAGDVQKILASIPPQMRANYTRDPKGFLSQWFMLKRLVQLAEEAKLSEKSPYKEGLEIMKMQVLSQAMIEENTKTSNVSAEDQKKHYEAKKDGYTQAMVKLVYIPFASTEAAAAGGKKTLTEKEAQAKAEGLAKEARGGADFVKMVAEHSEDPISKEKQGDFGPVKRADRLPEAIKSAVFQLKPGEVSEPVRQPNGYYIFRLQELKPQPYEEVKDAIFTELKNQRMNDWLASQAKAAEFTVERADYFPAK